MICRQILRRSVWSARRRLLSSNGDRVSDDRAPVLRLVDRSERVVFGARSVYVSCRPGLVELELGCLRSGVLHLQNTIRHRCRASSGHGVKPPQNRYKIICVGRNYAAHAKELGKPSPRSSLDRLRWLQVVGSEPVMFMKPTSSYLENGGTIEIPEPYESLDHEVELAALIHKRAWDVPKANAMDYVEGYALALDMTARELQSVAKSAGVPWTMAKGQDTFTPVGSVNPYNLRRCYFSSQVMLDVEEPGIVDVPLAQTGEGIAECELLQWFVQEGDLVDEFQRLCEVQSDKATIEITSRYKGRVAKVLHDPGSIVKVGATLLKMSVDDSAAPIQASIELSNAQSTETVMSDLNHQSSVLEKNKTRGVLSTPSVRSIAKQYAINIEEVSGSGRDGRVMKEDVLRFAAQKGLIEESSSSSDDESIERRAFCVESLSAPAANDLQFTDSRVPVRGYQRAMVKTMTAAAKVPHFHYVEEINCDALVKLKATFEKENADPSVKHTFLPLLIKSLSLAMSKFPFMNACFDENSQDIILKGSHNIGVAMATPHGLVVPNIKKVQSLSILEITKELSRLQLLARDNKLGPDDVSGGTITLSNIGAIGGKFGSPLLNLPEVAIIAMGRIEKVPRFDKDGDVYPSSVVTINMGADHRVLDGATVARFCNEWKSHIEKPELLLLQLR